MEYGGELEGSYRQTSREQNYNDNGAMMHKSENDLI